MKKLSLLLLLAVAFVFSYAQPEIKFESNTYDFGKIKEEGGKVTGRFNFTNVGNQPLELVSVRPGCGCTAANYTHGQIAPGESGYIEATYNPYNRPGAFTKNIRVTTNEPKFQENDKATPHMIFIKGEVIKRPPTEFEIAGYTKTGGMLRIKEPDVAHNVLNTQSQLDTFYVRNFWNKPVSIQLDNAPEFISEVNRNFGSELAPGKEGFIVLKYDASKRGKFGQQRDMINFKTNDSIEQTKRVHYAMNIKEDFSKLSAKQLKNAPVSSIEVEKLEYGEVARNSTNTKRFVIKNTGKSPLIIRALESSSSLFKVSAPSMEVPAGGSQEIIVVFKANNRNTTHRSTIDVITNDPNHPIYSVSASATVK